MRRPVLLQAFSARWDAAWGCPDDIPENVSGIITCALADGHANFTVIALDYASLLTVFRTPTQVRGSAKPWRQPGRLHHRPELGTL
jgi:hypothetical protein